MSLIRLYKAMLVRKEAEAEELEGPSALLPKKLQSLAKGMGPKGYWRLSSVLGSGLSLYTKMTILRRVAGLLKVLHESGKAHGAVGPDTVLLNRNLDVFLEKCTGETGNLDKLKHFDMLGYGILILTLMKDSQVEGSDFKNLMLLQGTEKKKLAAEEDGEEDYDKAVALGHDIETELRAAFLTTISVNTVIELCVQLCSPLLDMRPSSEDAHPWITESCKEVVKNDITDKTEYILQNLFNNKELMKEVVSNTEIEEIEEEEEEEEEEEKVESQQKEETGSTLSNDSYQPPVQEKPLDPKEKRKSAKLGAFLKATAGVQEREEDSSKSVAEGRRRSRKSTRGGKTRRRSLDRGYLDAKQKITKDETVESIIDEEQVIEFRERMKNSKHALSTVNLPDPNALKERFRLQDRLRIDEALSIIKRARMIMSEEPNLLSLDAPVMVVGDIHGQFYDLINLIELGGEPGSVLSVDENGVKRRRQYLFLGDYIDRGDFQCEVLLYLFALKAKHPAHVWLLRGNHECRTVAAYFGFKDECSKKYGLPLFNYAAETFQTMPIAATVSTSAGKFLCLHGGISPNVTSLHQFTEFDRFTEPAMTGFLCDVLWADPIKEDFEDGVTHSVSEFLSMDYLPNPARGCSFRYGFRAIVQFLAVNGLAGIIRAHEVQEEGYLYHFQDAGQGGNAQNAPPVITIFSAPNYCGRYMNKAAYMQISRDVQVRSVRKRALFRRKPKKVEVDLGMVVSPLKLLKPIQFEAVEAPDPLSFSGPAKDNELNVEKVCPYMPTTFEAFIQKALELASNSGGSGGPTITEAELKELKKKEEDAKKEKEAPPPVPPKLHGRDENKKNPNWKALQMLGLDDTGGPPGPGRTSGYERKAKKKKKPPTKQNKEFTEAARNDSVFEMRPELIKGKVNEAVKKFETSSIFQNLPDTIRLKEVAEAKRKQNKRLSTARDGKEKITFTKEEITALQALFLLIDRKGEGKIDTTDLVNWSRDSGNAVQAEEAQICLRYIDYDKDGYIGFKDYLVFAGKNKEIWLGEQYHKVMEQLNELREHKND